MTNAGSTWTEGRIARLEQMWAKGESASKIAASIGGVSRSAVLGKLGRLGLLNKRTQPTSLVRRSQPARKPRVSLAPTNPVEMGRVESAAAIKVKPEPQASSVIEPDINACQSSTPETGATIVSVQNGQCRWPSGHPRDPGFSLCGQSTGSPALVYCAAHRRIAYEPREARARANKQAGRQNFATKFRAIAGGFA